MTTRRRQQQEDNNEKTFNPTSDGSSQRTHSSVVSRGVRVCVKKKLSIFLPQKQTHTHTHTHIENPKHFFYGFKNHHFFFSTKARYYSTSQKNVTKDVS